MVGVGLDERWDLPEHRDRLWECSLTQMACSWTSRTLPGQPGEGLLAEFLDWTFQRRYE